MKIQATNIQTLETKTMTNKDAQYFELLHGFDGTESEMLEMLESGKTLMSETEMFKATK